MVKPEGACCMPYVETRGYVDAFESTKLLGEYQKAVKGRKPNLIQSWHVIAQFLELQKKI